MYGFESDYMNLDDAFWYFDLIDGKHVCALGFKRRAHICILI